MKSHGEPPHSRSSSYTLTSLHHLPWGLLGCWRRTSCSFKIFISILQSGSVSSVIRAVLPHPSSILSSILRFLIWFPSELRNAMQSIHIDGQFRKVVWNFRTALRERTIPQSLNSYPLKQNQVSKYRAINSFQRVKALRGQKRRLNNFPWRFAFERKKGSYIEWKWGWDSCHLISYM